ncbi:metallophosphoesterase [Kluyvera cryocrescens]|uniref:metallophosphoesterase n=1 Tax=Kluyvera cryocrescens TaxID=580 RepID=UPI002DB8C16A|nr:metallophosphoesterase [Kluyvera cryocrescens]MEB7712779.1 metallophosphoesterase [Kluyvera cryocrescens]
MSIRYKTIDGSLYRHIWCVGDIHGCYSLLTSGLSERLFDRAHDLVISVGDNIDRGSGNLEVLRLLDEPWFETVVGNHEEIALDAFATQDGNLWDRSGGSWFFKLNPEEQTEAVMLLSRFKSMPHVIEVMNNKEKYVITHADYPSDTYRLGKDVDYDSLLWSCDRVQNSLMGKHSWINGADEFIFGHMTFQQVMRFSNQVYIDTGAYSSRLLSFYQIK